jgi:hypothetical protein
VNASFETTRIEGENASSSPDSFLAPKLSATSAGQQGTPNAP